MPSFVSALEAKVSAFFSAKLAEAEALATQLKNDLDAANAHGLDLQASVKVLEDRVAQGEATIATLEREANDLMAKYELSPQQGAGA